MEETHPKTALVTPSRPVVTMRRKTGRCTSRGLLLCTSMFLATTAHASTSDSLWDSSWGNALPSGGDCNSSEMMLDDLPATKATSCEDDDEPWRAKEDWWKDPLSMFDDDNDDYIEDVGKRNQKKKDETQSTAADSDKMDAEKERQAAQLEREAADAEAAIRKAAQEKESLERRMEEARAALEAAASKRQQAEERAAMARASAEEEARQKAAASKAEMMAAQQKAAEAEAARERAACERRAALQVAKELAAQEKMAREMVEKERREQRQHDKELQRALKAASSPSTSRSRPFGIAVPNIAASLPLLSAGLSRLPFLPTLGLVASVAVGKVLFDKLRQKSSQKEESSSSLLPPEEDDLYPKALLDDTMQFRMDELRYTEEAYMEETTETSDDADAAAQHALEQEKIAQIGQAANPSPAFFHGLRSTLVGGHSRSPGDPMNGGRRIKVTADELEYLKTVAERAVTERQTMEREYEKTSFQLQEAQTEVSQLASTTKYLKSQLKDYEDMMDRTIRNERKRATAEIQKMRDLLDASIQEDRESLRKQFTMEVERLQAQYEAERVQKVGGANRSGNSTEIETSKEEEESMDESSDNEETKGPRARRTMNKGVEEPPNIDTRSRKRSRKQYHD